MATFLGTPTSSNLAATVTDETGSGALVFATSPTLVTPILGTPQSGNFSTGTFTWPTFNQNTTGTASNVTGTVAIANGGTGQTTKTAAYDALNPNTTLGDIAYRDSSNNVRLAGNTTTTKKFLTQTGNGTVSAAPAWGTLVAGDVPTLNQNTTGSAATLTTPRAIYGNNFDGSAALTQIIASTYGGTGNGFTKFSGATTTEKTYTLPDATCSILTSNTAVTIAQGGTGQTTASAAFNALSPITSTGDLIIGNGVNSATRLAIGTNGYVLTSNGTTATWSAVTGTGTVTSVNVSGGTTGLTTSGGPVTTSGTITLAGTLAVANGGTGQTTANAAFNALAPSQSTNSGKYLTTDGTNTSWATVNAGASLSNDTSTSSNLYPLFASSTTGTPTTIYTSNAKYLYKPSTGELSVNAPVAANGIFVNNATIGTSYTIASGYNGHSVGPVTLGSGVAVTVASGQRWLVL